MRKMIVIGAQNIDIFAKSEMNLVEGDSNPAKINLAFGGVGRNIAVNMKRLGHEVHFLSVFGDDDFSKSAQLSLDHLGIKTDQSLFLMGSSNSIYLGILDKDNELHLGLNDMQIIKELHPEFFKSKWAYINSFDTIIIDNNLSEESIAYLLNHLKDKVIIMDAVSAHKACKLKKYLDKISILKVNQLELDALSNSLSIKEKLENLHAKGAQTILLTHQEKASLVSKEDELVSQKPKLIKNIINATGAGDAFLSGYLHGFLSEKTEEDRLKMANFAAGITLTSNESTSLELNSEKIEEAINE